MAAKYPNNLEVQINEPIDTKLVCQNLSDLTDYLYVGLLTYQKSDGKYYYIKEMNNGIPTWEEFNSEGSDFEGLYLRKGTNITGPHNTIELGNYLKLDSNIISVDISKQGQLVVTSGVSPIQQSTIDKSLILSITTLIGSETSSAQIRVSSNVIKNRVLNDETGGYIELDFSNLGGGGSPDFTVGTGPICIGEDKELFIRLGTFYDDRSLKGGGLQYIRNRDGSTSLSICTGFGLDVNSDRLEILIGTDTLYFTDEGYLSVKAKDILLDNIDFINDNNYLRAVCPDYSFYISTLAFGKGIKVTTHGTDTVMDIDVASPLYINGNNQIDFDNTGIEYIDSIQDIVKKQFTVDNGFIVNNVNGVEEISLNIGTGLEISDSNALTISEEIVRRINNKQDLLESGTNIKTINNESILGEGNITITGGPAEYISDFINGGVVNLTTTGDVETIYNSLDNGAIALCIIGDSNGNYPSSTENRINVNSNYCQALKYFFSTDSRGANVGDLLLITKQTYLSFLNIPALKIIPINDAKVDSDNFVGTEGILTVWDKVRINKVDGIEWTANNALPRQDMLPSRWNNNMNDALHTGVYPWCTLGCPTDSTGAYTCIVKRTSTNDGNYDTIEQTAYGREGELGQVYKRIIFQHKDGNDTQYGAWRRIDVDLSEYAKSADVQSAIEEVNAKIDMYKEATIDFGTGEDTVTMAIMDSGTTITKVKMKNVKTLYLSYGNVTKAEYVGGEVALGNADFLVMTIIRTASDVDAVVGLTLR